MAESAAPLPDLRAAPIRLGEWYEENKAVFAPPICNKLMHKDQLTVMFVGGPNTRTDFHLDEGSEFFYQIKGDMELPTIQQGKRKLVQIKAGQVFLLPSRIPHSPQRPVADGLGLVIERKRDEATEMDGLRWYVDFEKCEEVLYERHFYCGDLGRDLVPVVKTFKASEECRTGVPREDSVPAESPFVQDVSTAVPDPFDLQSWLDRHHDQLAAGADLCLFPGHPDKEFNVRIIGGESTQSGVFPYETFFYQLRGEATIQLEGQDSPFVLPQDGCYVVDSGVPYVVRRTVGSIGMVVTQDPLGNKPSSKRRRTA